MNPLLLAAASRGLARFAPGLVRTGLTGATGFGVGSALGFGRGSALPRRRRRRGIPKSIMADVAQVKAILGPKAASETLQILLSRG